MNKDISKAIMNRVRLRNRFLKSRSFEDKRLTIKKGTTECHLSGTKMD